MVARDMVKFHYEKPLDIIKEFLRSHNYQDNDFCILIVVKYNLQNKNI